MSKIANVLSSLAAALLIAGLLFVGVSSARADDKLTLKDGRVLEGVVTRELDGYVWFKAKLGGIEQVQMYTPEEIASLERDAAAAAAATPAPEKSDPKPRAPGVSGTPKGAVITLGEAGDKDMVGLFMTAAALKDAIPLLEAEGVNVVVFRIKSGGGALLEIQRLSDVIHNDYKPRFRTVAWIDSAISAAAMTAHCLEEIYMTKQGNYGACTGWSGALVAMKGRSLEEVLYMMEKISARGQHDPKIMRSMQIMEPLSADIDANGDVTWHQDATSGEFVLNPEGRILTFNAVTAEKFKFSRGTADTLDELGKLMGYQEIEWVGKPTPGFDWPICDAEKLQMDFRAKTYEDQELVGKYWTSYQMAVAAAQGTQDPNERGKFVNRARGHLNNIRSMCENNPNFKIFVFNMTDEEFEAFLEAQEKLLRDLMRR